MAEPEQWASRKNRKPLILKGPRQVGKFGIDMSMRKTTCRVLLDRFGRKTADGAVV